MSKQPCNQRNIEVVSFGGIPLDCKGMLSTLQILMYAILLYKRTGSVTYRVIAVYKDSCLSCL